jgi:hypothetical protein
MSIFDDAKTAAKSLTKAVGKATVQVASGGDLFVDKQTEMKRLAICKACPEYTKPLGQCAKCLCFCATKVTITTEECPLQKWSQQK